MPIPIPKSPGVSPVEWPAEGGVDDSAVAPVVELGLLVEVEEEVMVGSYVVEANEHLRTISFASINYQHNPSIYSLPSPMRKHTVVLAVFAVLVEAGGAVWDALRCIRVIADAFSLSRIIVIGRFVASGSQTDNRGAGICALGWDIVGIDVLG